MRGDGWIVALCLVFGLGGCGGGSEGDVAVTSAPAVAPPGGCPAASSWDGTQCAVFAQRSVERLATPWTEGGRALTLEVVVYRPLTPPPWPALVFHHGSTGGGTDPALFAQTFESLAIAREFATRGFLVWFPQRRGRGGSDGLYDEGFGADRTAGYSCQRGPALAGLDRALEDAGVIADRLLERADVDRSRIAVAGFSRGGALAISHAARRPGLYRGAINFVGGWLSEGCVDAGTVNRSALASIPVDKPTLWIYAENDPFYSLSHSRSHFDAFVALGGVGEWHALRRADAASSGHLVHQEPALWRSAVGDYLARQGLQ